MPLRVEERRAGDACGEHRSLLDGELVDGLAEVRLRGRLDAMRSAAEIDRVQIPVQDLVLGVVLVDLDREDEFLELAGQRLLGGEVGVLDVLLRDRRTALRSAPGEVVPGRPRDPGHREPWVGVKAAVLCGQHCLADVLGNPRQRYVGAVLLAEAGHLRRAVAVVHDRHLIGLDVVGPGYIGRGVDDADERQRHHDEQSGATEDEPAADAALALGLRSVAPLPPGSRCRIGVALLAAHDPPPDVPLPVAGLPRYADPSCAVTRWRPGAETRSRRCDP